MRSRTHWAVRLNRGRRTVHVHADYHVIEGGVLKFRNSERGTYPINVMAFAPGEWVSVTNLDIEVEP